MRIDAFNQISRVYGANGSRKTEYTSKTSKSDKVEISSFGKDLQIAKHALESTPDVREDRVAEYRRRIASGDYNVSSEAFAEKILKKLENS